MDANELAENLGRLCVQALNDGVPASQVIGNLEIAKLNVDRLLCQAQAAAERKKLTKTILPPNGIQLPRG